MSALPYSTLARFYPRGVAGDEPSAEERESAWESSDLFKESAPSAPEPEQRPKAAPRQQPAPASARASAWESSALYKESSTQASATESAKKAVEATKAGNEKIQQVVDRSTSVLTMPLTIGPRGSRVSPLSATWQLPIGPLQPISSPGRGLGLGWAALGVGVAGLVGLWLVARD